MWNHILNLINRIGVIGSLIPFFLVFLTDLSNIESSIFGTLKDFLVQIVEINSLVSHVIDERAEEWHKNEEYAECAPCVSLNLSVMSYHLF